MNIINELNLQSKEDVMSDLIRVCVKNSKEFSDFFCKNICNLKKDYDSIDVLTRISVNDKNIPDILAVGCYGENCDICIVENKMLAEEGQDQTIRYADKDMLPIILNKRNKNFIISDILYTFLTLYPDQEPKSSQFQHITYKEFVNFFSKFKKEMALPLTLMSQWIELIKDFYDCELSNDSALFREVLTKNNELEGSYLSFKSIFNSIALPSQLSIDFFYRASNSGRRYYGAVITKPEWYSEEVLPINDKKALGTFKCDKNYFIHLEPQYDTIKNILTIPLHYEMNPYLPEREAKEIVLPDILERYKMDRNKFISYMQNMEIESFEFGGGWNQIGKLNIATDGNATIRAFKEKFVYFIEKVAYSVDKFFRTNNMINHI